VRYWCNDAITAIECSCTGAACRDWLQQKYFMNILVQAQKLLMSLQEAAFFKFYFIAACILFYMCAWLNSKTKKVPSMVLAQYTTS